MVVLTHLLLLLILQAAPSPATAKTEGQTGEEKPKDSCVWCHAQLEDDVLTPPVEGMKKDVHSQAGLSCADCHGGDRTVGFDFDPVAPKAEGTGYRGAPERTEIPAFCARCHSDPKYMRQFNPRLPTEQFARYQTSVHGQLLKKGDTNVATCTDCHGVHGILKAGDPRSSVYPNNIPDTCGRCHADPEHMKPYDIPTDQVEKYRSSVHGIALLEKGDRAAPVCNSCHGNHGASPPNSPSIAYVCGQCHANNSELFLASPHFAAFRELDLPECEACHGNHAIQAPTDEFVGSGKGSVCVECHEGETKVLDQAAAMRQQIETLKAEVGDVGEIVDTAETAGMDVGEARFDLSQAHDSLIRARTLVHSLSVERIAEVVKEGAALSEKARQRGVEALAELEYRRKGLAVSLVFILILAAGLFLKIREVDRAKPW